MPSANRIHLPADSKFSNAITDEARRFELKITDARALTFAGEGTSKDDLIMALTYILWYGERTTSLTGRAYDGFSSESQQTRRVLFVN